jgi:hypothetical protein
VLARQAHRDWIEGVRLQQPAWRETLPPDVADRVETAADGRLATQPL